MLSYTYLLVNFICIAIPLAASFYPKHSFFKQWESFFKANLIVAVVFLIWDYFFVKMGVWGFNQDYLIGISIGNLPVEEILFFLCIPYACVFTYFSLKYLIPRNPLSLVENYLTITLIIVLLIVAILNSNKLYTSITFLLLTFYLTYLKFKKRNLAYHFLSYIFIFPLFLISNGILTGSFLVEPIVWYNDLENLGVRIFNIPIEDVFYGLLLIFLNIEFFEYFNKRNYQNISH